MTSKKITKRQLKEDAFVSAAFETGHFLRGNLNKLILGAVGVLVAVGAVWFYISYRQDRLQEASAALFKAQAIYLQGQYELAATDFEKVAEEYSGLDDGIKALFYAGESHFNAGDNEQALARFEQCLDKLGGNDPLAINCLVGMGAAYEQMKNPDQALESYRQAEQKARYDYQKLEIMHSEVRVLAGAGRNAEALELMDKMIEQYPDNPRIGQVRELRAELVAKAQGAAPQG